MFVIFDDFSKWSVQKVPRNFEKSSFVSKILGRNFNKYHLSFYHRPPEGCLQYFVGTEGRLKSFNWDGGNGHLESQAYTMCIRQEKGFCCNKYSLCATETVFTLGLHMMVATPGMAQADGLCTQDYIIIEGIIFFLL